MRALHSSATSQEDFYKHGMRSLSPGEHVIHEQELMSGVCCKQTNQQMILQARRYTSCSIVNASTASSTCTMPSSFTTCCKLAALS